jgi:hypothetical protein
MKAGIAESESRDRRERGERHCRDRRVEKRAGGRHPSAAAEIVHHHQGESGKRHAQPEQKRAQPGAEKAGRIERAADGAAGSAEDQRSERGEIQPGPGAVGNHCGLRRLSAGTSASEALALACNARM